MIFIIVDNNFKVQRIEYDSTGDVYPAYLINTEKTFAKKIDVFQRPNKEMDGLQKFVLEFEKLVKEHGRDAFLDELIIQANK